MRIVVFRLPDSSWSNWNLEMLVFEERGKLEYLEKNVSEQRREPTTNSTHKWRRRRDMHHCTTLAPHFHNKDFHTYSIQ